MFGSVWTFVEPHAKAVQLVVKNKTKHNNMNK